MLLLGIHSPSLCCQLAPGPNPSPPLFHPVTPADSGASFSNAVARCRGESCFPLRLETFGGAFPSPPPFPNLALAPGALELAGVYLKFPSKTSFHLLEEGFLSASVFVWLFLQRCWELLCFKVFPWLLASIETAHFTKEGGGTLLSHGNFSNECPIPAFSSRKHKAEQLQQPGW